MTIARIASRSQRRELLTCFIPFTPPLWAVIYRLKSAFAGRLSSRQRPCRGYQSPLMRAFLFLLLNPTTHMKSLANSPRLADFGPSSNLTVSLSLSI